MKWSLSDTKLPLPTLSRQICISYKNRERSESFTIKIIHSTIEFLEINHKRFSLMLMTTSNTNKQKQEDKWLNIINQTLNLTILLLIKMSIKSKYTSHQVILLFLVLSNINNTLNLKQKSDTKQSIIKTTPTASNLLLYIIKIKHKLNRTIKNYLFHMITQNNLWINSSHSWFLKKTP